MAVTTTAIDSEMVLVVEDGTTASGATKYRNSYLADLKPDADNQNVFDTAVALFTLQTKPVAAVQRRDLTEISASE